MWTREQLKRGAKSVLKESYWKAFLVSILLTFIGGGGSNGFNFNFNINNSNNNRDGRYIYQSIMNHTREVMPYIIPVVIISVIVIFIIFAIRIFIGYTIEVGGKRYFIKAAQKDANLNNLGYSFNSNRYMNIVKVMLYKGVLIFLWSLLFIIPGIIKSYAYSMVPYILADNPSIGYQRAIEISNGMTNGEKEKMFVLDLSFIGWYIIGAVAFGIGVLFVNPYVNSTEAELYLVLKQKAIDTGICSREELMIDEFTK